jgi:alpha-1,3-rhamnosyl/mannosyltransferase
MLIGYDPTPLGAHFGNSSYTTELIRAMAPLFTHDRFLVPSFFEDRWRQRSLFKNSPNFKGAPILPNPMLFGKIFRKKMKAFAQTIESRRLLSTYDLYHCTSPTLWVEGAKKSVVTIHDLIPLVGHETWASSWDRAFYQARLAGVVERSTAIIVDSFATRSLVVDRFPACESKIHVIHLAAGPQFVEKSVDGRSLLRYGIDGLDRRIIVSVGVFTERKNMSRFLDAFASLPADSKKDILVVLTGSRRKNNPYPPIREAIARNGLEKCVLVVPNLPQTDLITLYNLAYALVFPSLSEGFGLPVLEAMQCGCPVITSNRSSLPEAGGDAALYCDPEDRESMAAALERILSDTGLRSLLIQKGLKQAALFTWEKTAIATHAVYEKSFSDSRD